LVYLPDDPQFAKIIQDVELAIDQEVFPERISQGSSGSYFCKNSSGVCTAKFYSLLSAQRTCKVCTIG